MSKKRRRSDPDEPPELREVEEVPQKGEEVVTLGVEPRKGEVQVRVLSPDRIQPGERGKNKKYRDVSMDDLRRELGEGEAAPPRVQTGGSPEKEWEEASKRVTRVPIGWVVLVALVLLGLLAVALVRVPKGERKLERAAATLEERLKEKEAEALSAAALNEEILTVARAYLAAKTVEEKIKYVRMPERVRPLMEEYYANTPLVPQVAEGLYYFEPVSFKNYAFVLLKLQLADGGEEVMMMEHGEDGEVRVDWESDVAYSEITLDEYVAAKPLEPQTLRVNVAYDTFYSFEFSDAEEYVSLFLSERDRPGYLFGYVKRGSEEHEQLMEVMGTEPEEDVRKVGRFIAPMMLKVRFLPETRGERSVLVEEVVAPGWALVESEIEGE